MWEGLGRPLTAIGTGVALLWGACQVQAATEEVRPSQQAWYALQREVVQRYPHIGEAMGASRHDGFGGDASRAIANRMASRDNPAALEDARNMLKVEEVGEGTWFLRWPWVNSVVFETPEGLVLVDTGHAPAGPALVDTLEELSDKPVHTVIFTHHHLDHAYGAWALEQLEESPRIIAHESFLHEMGLDVRLADYTNALLNNQHPDDVPRSLDEMTLPTETFAGKQKVLTIGGERFILNHARGETDDHLWVDVPGRDLVVSGDLHQPFLPNAGNGKRRQRHLQEWADALREMAAREPAVLLPLHGPAIRGETQVQGKLDIVASALESVVQQVVAGLNSGLPKHAIVESVSLPDELAGHPDLDTYYNTVQDMAKMAVREYSGWWDGIPSHWAPAPRAEQARAIVALAGGMDALVTRTRELLESDPTLAAHFADWAYAAQPDDPRVLQLGLDVYARRIQPGAPVNQIGVYVQHMAELLWRLQRQRG